MKYIELKQHLESAKKGVSNYAPAYLVVGDDSYLCKDAIDQFKTLIDETYADFNLSIFTKENSLYDAVDSLNMFPMCDVLRVTLCEIKEEPYDENEVNYLKKYFVTPSETSILVLYGSEQNIDNFGLNDATTVNCSQLDDATIMEEVIGLCNEKPRKAITTEAIAELGKRTQNNMSRIVSEIMKLKAYADKEITKEDVIELVSEDVEYKTYDFATAVGLKKSDEALSILNDFLYKGMKSSTIFSILYNNYRRMLHAELNKQMSNEDLGKLLGMTKGAVFYLKKASSTYTQVRLKKCVDYLHSMQYQRLCGIYEDEASIHNVVIELLNI